MAKAVKVESPFRKYLMEKSVNDALFQAHQTMNMYEDGDLVITVHDRGWAFIGFVTKLANGIVRLDSAFNLHKWGTDKGLGQLAVGGPREETILNPAGTVYGQPILVMKCDIEQWG